MPRRPLRSVFLGNPRYLSVYALGVAQAMGIFGHWHRSVSLFDPLPEVSKQVAEMRPDVIWTHMALWPPKEALSVDHISEILAHWKYRGTAVYLHDGDPRERELKADVPAIFSMALVNRSIDVDHWKIPCLKWPYAAMVQREIAPACEEWACELLFAGIVREGKLYGERSVVVSALRERLCERMRVISPQGGDVNNRMLAADVAASADAVLGFSRPEVPGWIDSRCFQYPGAGGVLIHDDAGEYLVPGEHYLKFDRADAVDSVLRCVERAKNSGALRERAFRHVQAKHTWVHRVNQALEAFYGRG